MPKIPPQPKGRPSSRTNRPFDAFGGKGGGAYVFVPDGEFDACVLAPPEQYEARQPIGPPRGNWKGHKGKGKGPMPPWGPPPMAFQHTSHRQEMAPPPMNTGPPPNMDKILGRAHDAISTAVWEAVKEVEEHLGETPEAEVAKKVTRYMFKAISDPELMRCPWEEFCDKLVKGMFHGYASACGEAQWFFHIDLSHALTAAALVVLPAAGWRIPPDQVLESIQDEIQINLDRMTLEKAMWEMVESLFGDDTKIRTKVFHALSKSYDPALKLALADPTPMEDIQRVKIFAKHWIDDSACRAWGGLQENAETLLNQETLVEMFDHLLQPFGDDHPFSAIPRELTENIGAPPRGWDFIPQVVEDLFQTWQREQNEPRKSKKRKKKGGGEDAEGQEELAPIAETGGLIQVPVSQAKRAKKRNIHAGHPDCTSGPDCAGGPDEGLVQHILEDGPGDMYCGVCWNSFKSRNPELEGVPVED